MRSELISAIQGLGSAVLGNFTVSEQLPWTKDGQPLILKNLRTIYVDQPDRDLDPILDTLDGRGFATEVVTVSVSFATDAKQLPSNHATLVAALLALRLDFSSEGYRQRRVTVTNEFSGDMMISSFGFSFQRTVNN